MFLSTVLKSVLFNIRFIPKFHMVVIWLTEGPDLNDFSFNFSEKRSLLFPKQIQKKYLGLILIGTD